MNQKLSVKTSLSTSIPIEKLIINDETIELDYPHFPDESMSNLIELDNGEHIYIEVDVDNNLSIRSSTAFEYELSLSLKTKES